jgi:hypothetical protein
MLALQGCMASIASAKEEERAAGVRREQATGHQARCSLVDLIFDSRTY